MVLDVSCGAQAGVKKKISSSVVFFPLVFAARQAPDKPKEIRRAESLLFYFGRGRYLTSWLDIHYVISHSTTEPPGEKKFDGCEALLLRQQGASRLVGCWGA